MTQPLLKPQQSMPVGGGVTNVSKIAKLRVDTIKGHQFVTNVRPPSSEQFEESKVPN